jgi:thioredoxin reductase (NADPH)
MAEIYDICVIGQGPAGLSAAIYAVRQGVSVVLIGRDNGSLARADKIENYFGFIEPISGSELLARGQAQAKRLGVELVQAEVTGISYADPYQIETTAGLFTASCVVLATGMPRRKALVPGITEYEGRGVSYCSTCDGFFFRGKNLAILGSGEYAVKEYHELLPIARQVTLFTNGRPLDASGQDAPTAVDTRKILRAEGDDYKVRRLVLAGPSGGEGDAEAVEVDGIFVAEGTASALDLAYQLGLDNDGKAILVDPSQQTNLPGFFAIGDCTGGLMQVAVAVGEGAKAGITAAKYVRKQKGGASARA